MTYSNVNSVEEMVNMISASLLLPKQHRGDEHGQSLLLKTLQLGQS